MPIHCNRTRPCSRCIRTGVQWPMNFQIFFFFVVRGKTQWGGKIIYRRGLNMGLIFIHLLVACVILYMCLYIVIFCCSYYIHHLEKYLCVHSTLQGRALNVRLTLYDLFSSIHYPLAPTVRFASITLCVQPTL